MPVPLRAVLIAALVVAGSMTLPAVAQASAPAGAQASAPAPAGAAAVPESAAPAPRPAVARTSAVTSAPVPAACAPLPGTAFATPAATGTLADGQVDCWTFVGDVGHQVDITLSAAGPVDAALRAPDGTLVCTVFDRTTCELPSDGRFRVVVAGGTGVYSLWVADFSDRAGCVETVADPFGEITDRSGALNGNINSRCWTFRATATSHVVRTSATRGGLFAQLRIVRPDGLSACTVFSIPRVCQTTPAGQYLLVLQPYSATVSDGQHVLSRVGLWRTDQGCAPADLSYVHAPEQDALDAAGVIDCRTLSVSEKDRVIAQAAAPHGQTAPTVATEILSVDGGAYCLPSMREPCLVSPRGDGAYLALTFSFTQATGPYSVSIRTLVHPVGCRAMGPSEFGTAPTRAFSLPSGGFACGVLTGADSAAGVTGRVVNATGTADNARGWLYDANGRQRCYVDRLGQCALRVGHPALLVVSSDRRAQGSFGWYDSLASGGCSPVATGSFADPPVDGALDVAGEVDCIDLGQSPDNRIDRFAIASAPDGMVLHFEVIGRDGSTTCSWASTDFFRSRTCGLPAGYPHRLLVWANESKDVATGAYALHVWQISQPTGCTGLGSAAAGLGPVTGALADPNDQDCYVFSGTEGTVLDFEVHNREAPRSVPLVYVLTPNVRYSCEIYARTGTCTLPRDGRFTMLVYGWSGRPDFAGHYVITATSE